jgi:hypothetical protein
VPYLGRLQQQRLKPAVPDLLPPLHTTMQAASAPADLRNGTLLWSDPSTWGGSTRKPKAGQNVTVPFGWNLVIDESPPALEALVIEGNVSFDRTRDVALTAMYIVVRNRGYLQAGTPDEPHPTRATIYLQGTRQTRQWAVSNTLNIGSRVRPWLACLLARSCCLLCAGT